jgi:xanthine dehydrogenase accessory factor
MKDIHEEIIKAKEEGEIAALATVVATKGSTPRSIGAKMLVKEDGTIIGSIGGGCVEAEVWQSAMKTIKEKTPKLIDYDLTGREDSPEGLICGGIMQVFVEPIIPEPVVYILGAGHIGFAVSRIAAIAGFRVVVIDDRPAYASKERFPDAAELHVGQPEEMITQLKINKVSYLVIACRGHMEDQRTLKEALKTPACYTSMIGSKKKVKTIFENLRNEGVTQDDLNRVHAPIGLPIAAETPEDIAISIMAEIVDIRRRKPGKEDHNETHLS